MTVPAKLKGLSENDTAALLGLPGHLTLLAYRGSVAHGMYVPPTEPTSIDDKDLMGVYFGPPEHYIGFPRGICNSAIERMMDPWDVVFYEIRKFVHLLTKSNPNVLSMLWLEETDYIHIGAGAARIIEHRGLFASRAAYNSFVGYARSQLSRMERHEHHGRMGAKRKALVERFGYDTKNASHLIRLLRLGTEFLSTGVLQVKRPDAPELLAIKRGEWSLERVKAEAEAWFGRAADALSRSALPDRPDRDRIERLLVEIVGEHFGWRVP